MPVCDKDDLQRAISRLGDNVTAFNAGSAVPYKISLSIGYDGFLDEKAESAKAFIRHLDNLMYRDKHGGPPA